jgi:hypothetical protein
MDARRDVCLAYPVTVQMCVLAVLFFFFLF